ncbi:hypothetical protein oki361_24910 [Helicobacter pylori]
MGPQTFFNQFYFLNPLITISNVPNSTNLFFDHCVTLKVISPFVLSNDSFLNDV